MGLEGGMDRISDCYHLTFRRVGAGWLSFLSWITQTKFLHSHVATERRDRRTRKHARRLFLCNLIFCIRPLSGLWAQKPLNRGGVGLRSEQGLWQSSPAEVALLVASFLYNLLSCAKPIHIFVVHSSAYFSYWLHILINT